MMMKDCLKIGTIIDSWEESGAISEKEYNLFIRHLKSCPNCRMRYGCLKPLLAREVNDDAALKTAGPGVKLESAEVFTDQVMTKIAEQKETEFPTRTRNIAPFIAAAAALLVIGGLVLKFSVLPFGTEGTLHKQDAEYIKISFTLTAPEAEDVHLVGDFTGWESSKIYLEDPDGDGVWEVEVKLRKGDVYSYNFVINGEDWIPDPNSLFEIDDGFGGKSSLLSL